MAKLLSVDHGEYPMDEGYPTHHLSKSEDAQWFLCAGMLDKLNSRRIFLRACWDERPEGDRDKEWAHKTFAHIRKQYNV